MRKDPNIFVIGAGIEKGRLIAELRVERAQLELAAPASGRLKDSGTHGNGGAQGNRYRQNRSRLARVFVAVQHYADFYVRWPHIPVSVPRRILKSRISLGGGVYSKVR